MSVQVENEFQEAGDHLRGFPNYNFHPEYLLIDAAK